MKRYSRIGTACVVILALMVDSVAACWLFSRRANYRACPSPCYSAPVSYSSCGMPGAAYSTVPGPNGSAPSMRIPWVQPLNGGAARQPTPANKAAPSSPSDRPSTFRETTPERQPMAEPPTVTEPMPEPSILPGDATVPPDTTPPGDSATPRPGETTPMPDATDTENPFGATRPAETPEATPPVERTAPDDNPFPPRPPAGGETTPSDNPFGPSGTPPAADPLNPFETTSGGADPAGASTPTNTTPETENSLTPRTPATTPSDPQPSIDNPFGGTPSASGSTPADPFGPAPDTTPASTEGADTPTSSRPAAPMSESSDSAPADSQQPAPAADDPFADPAGPRLSLRVLEPEPADAMRAWTDVTGKHRIRGRMTLILDEEQKVRILKETGKYTTVPFAKLSKADRMFVAHHAMKPSALLAENR